jgi:AcrR family transcriptional regulator
MGKKKIKAAKRRTRADALQNRGRIVEVAKEAFREFGAEASLDEIARQAGVGAGTLYRHFPSRDALIEAVFHAEVEKLAEAAAKFSERMAPVEALRAWMQMFVDYIAAKHIIAPALNALPGGPGRLYEGSRGKIHGALDGLARRAIKNGDLRRDLDPSDLLRALIGVAYMPAAPGWQESAKRLVNILIEGSRA